MTHVRHQQTPDLRWQFRFATGFSPNAASMNRVCKFLLPLLCLLLLAAQPAICQTSQFNAGSAPSRILGPINGARLVLMQGNTRPETRTGKDLGIVEPSHPSGSMWVVLQRSPGQEAKLEKFMAEHLDVNSGSVLCRTKQAAKPDD